MKYSIHFKGWAPSGHMGEGATGDYTLLEFCTRVVDWYSLTEEELEHVCRLEVGGSFKNNDMLVMRIK